MRLILLGAPGAGKGTQARLLMEKLEVPAISTGDLLRDEMARGTKLGEKVTVFMKGGKLVPDELVLDLVKERISQPDCENGMIFDGFPRTIAQAEALDKIMKVDMALFIDVDDDAIVSRISGRRTCPVCKASYHVESQPPKAEGVCDECGSKLVIREDDRAEIVRERINVYHKQTQPIVDYYESKGILKVVKGQEKVSDTTALVAQAIGVNV